MSSSVTLTFANEIPLDDWTNFCATHKIDYSPDTIGQATFYKGEAEITVFPEGSLKRDEMGGRYGKQRVLQVQL